MVEVEHAIEPSATLHSTTNAVYDRAGAMYQSIAQSLMISFAMIVRRVLGKRMLK